METIHPNQLRDVRGGMVSPVVGQVVLAILAATVNDGNYLAGIVAIGVLVHWVVVGLITIRRRNALTRADVTLIRYGYLLYSAAATLAYVGIAAIMWSTTNR